MVAKLILLEVLPSGSEDFSYGVKRVGECVPEEQADGDDGELGREYTPEEAKPSGSPMDSRHSSKLCSNCI